MFFSHQYRTKMPSNNSHLTKDKIDIIQFGTNNLIKLQQWPRGKAFILYLGGPGFNSKKNDKKCFND